MTIVNEKMQKFFKVLLALLFSYHSCFANAALSYGPSPEITIPEIGVYGESIYYTLRIIDEAPICNLLLSDVKSAVESSNLQFLRRAWSDGFLNDRFAVAEEYSSRSKYGVVTTGVPFSPRPNDPIVGTAGVTYAKYDKQSLISPETLESIPFEKTLKLKKPVPRPLDSNGKGIIFELRTYSKDKDKGKEAFPNILHGIYQMIFGMLKNYPGLLKKEILYLYGDETSVRFYQFFGFHILADSVPVLHEGVEWHLMVASPNDIETAINKINGYRSINGLNSSQLEILPNGTTIWTAPHTQFSINKENRAVDAITQYEIEVVPGIFASENSRVNWGFIREWNIETKLPRAIDTVTINRLSKPAYMKKLNVWIPKGSQVVVKTDGEVMVAFLSAPLTIPDLGITIGSGGFIKTNSEFGIGFTDHYVDEIQVWKLEQAAVLQPDLIAPAGDTELMWLKQTPATKYRVREIRRENDMPIYILPDGIQVSSYFEYAQLLRFSLSK